LTARASERNKSAVSKVAPKAMASSPFLMPFEASYFIHPTSGEMCSRKSAPEGSGEKHAAQFVHMSNYYAHGEGGLYSVNLRDFESIPIFFSEEEIEVLQAAIDERRRRTLAPEEERTLEPAEQSDYSPKLVECEFSEVRRTGKRARPRSLFACLETPKRRVGSLRSDGTRGRQRRKFSTRVRRKREGATAAPQRSQQRGPRRRGSQAQARDTQVP